MADKKKGKLPKRIAGVKVPKSLRKSGKAIAGFAQNPLAREILASGLVAAAAALATDKRVQRAAGKVGEGAQDAATSTADTAARIGQAIAAAISSAAHRIHPEHDDRTPRVAAVDAKADRVRKKDRPVAAS